MKKKFLISFIGSISIFAGVVWVSETRYNSEIVRIKDIHQDSILFVNGSGTEIRIMIPEAISNSIHTDEEYYVSYSKKKWSNWKLDEIAPIED